MTLTYPLWREATLAWIDDPVVVFQRVHSLKHSADTSYAAIDMRVGEEVRCEVAIQAGLHRRRSVDP